MKLLGTAKFKAPKIPANYNCIDRYERRLVREEYVRLQDGLCYYCKAPLSGNPSDSVLNKPLNKSLFPPNMFNYPIHLHHNHDTGITIGAVHCHCNAVLWQHHGE